MLNENFKYLNRDIPSGLVVFLVALPLCLGIALASGAPLFSGLIAGIVGGIVIGSLSGSHLSVSGPAAGLTVIVLSAIEKLGAYEAFLVAVVIAGILQVAFGFLRGGIVGHFFPSSVIKGMLSAIGLILILKQIPHALGDDKDYEGDDAFFQMDGENTLSEIILAIQNIEPAALFISILSLGILILWDNVMIKKFAWARILPGALFVVLGGVFINILIGQYMPGSELKGVHLVSIPVAESAAMFFDNLIAPDFSHLVNPDVYVVAITIAIVASLETLLSLDAIDKLDPLKRIAPQNRELRAQGVGNLISGMLGGLPVTSVIIRSSANVGSGARTKMSAVIHGIFLISTVAFIPKYLNMIPLAALAAVLLQVGYKLTKPAVIKGMYNKGWDQFIPFMVTIVTILFTDLLTGIIVGILVGIFYVIKTNYHQTITITEDGNDFTIKFNKDVFFMNKANIRRAFERIPDDAHVIFDQTKAGFIDSDITDLIKDFKESAVLRNIQVEIKR